MRDSAHALQEQVRQAQRDGRVLQIRGGGSKAFYGHPLSGERLSLSAHRGILSYQPGELVITARAGTPLREIDEALAARGQMLACEPPHFGPATLGGAIAAGLSGPGRAYAGGIADQVLGCTLLNGRGEILRFGGKVMKNVAGYDVSRLMVGAQGCLGVILEATLRVMPRPAAERSFRFQVERGRASAFLNTLAAQGFPLSASCHDGHQLSVRFSAGEREIAGLDSALRRQFDFFAAEEEPLLSFWEDLREQRMPFFTRGEGDLWRLSLPPAAPDPELPGDLVVEWNGALRWLRTRKEPREVFEKVAALGGSATLFRAADDKPREQRFQPLPPPLLAWHHQLKQAFDPARILNPGRLYREL